MAWISCAVWMRRSGNVGHCLWILFLDPTDMKFWQCFGQLMTGPRRCGSGREK